MLVTSLRVIWKSEKAKRTNLSVGLTCVVNITMRATQSRLKGDDGTSPCPSTAPAAVAARSSCGDMLYRTSTWCSSSRGSLPPSLPTLS